MVFIHKVLMMLIGKKQKERVDSKKKDKKIGESFWSGKWMFRMILIAFLLFFKQKQSDVETTIQQSNFFKEDKMSSAQQIIENVKTTAKEKDETKESLSLSGIEVGARVKVIEEVTGKTIFEKIAKKDENVILKFSEERCRIEIKKEGYLPLTFFNVNQENIRILNKNSIENSCSIFMIPETKLTSYCVNLAQNNPFTKNRAKAYKSYHKFLMGEQGCYDRELGEKKNIAEFYNSYFTEEFQNIEKEESKKNFMLFDFDGDGMEELFLRITSPYDGSGYDFCIGEAEEHSLELIAKFEVGARWENRYYKNGIFYKLGSSGATAHSEDIWQYSRNGDKACLYYFESVGVEAEELFINTYYCFIDGRAYHMINLYNPDDKDVFDIETFLSSNILDSIYEEIYHRDWYPVSEEIYQSILS